MRYGFTRSVARIEIAIGAISILAAAGLAIAAVLIAPQLPILPLSRSPREDLLTRALLAAAVFLAGVLIGTGLIVHGQLMLVFLDVRTRLARIDRRLRSWETLKEQDSPLTERLRPR